MKEDETVNQGRGARSKRVLAALGPGILFAAAAVGVSHLVQATRAGADYGFALIAIVVLALVVKYPFFEFGPRFVAATGESLIDGYRRVGDWALGLYLVSTFMTMFSTLAAVTLVTAGIAANVFLVDLPITLWASLLLGSVTVLLIVGQYPWLDRITKGLMVVLLTATVFATFVAGFERAGAVELARAPSVWTSAGIAFMVALVGWMPAPIEVAVWHSLWAIERSAQTKQTLDISGARLDFNLGYGIAGLLALLFPGTRRLDHVRHRRALCQQARRIHRTNLPPLYRRVR